MINMNEGWDQFRTLYYKLVEPSVPVDSPNLRKQSAAKMMVNQKQTWGFNRAT